MNEGKPKISIIIPIYNAEKYLARCLDSIFDFQIFDNYEVIAVDDASIDNSCHILKKYKKNQNRLKIIEHRINKKVSIARSTGIEASTGDYIMFMDSDDCLLPNALIDIYTKCVESDADIVVFDHIVENINGKKSYLNNIEKEIITTDKVKVQKLFYATPWNKIVKRELVVNMVVGQVGLNMTEDLLYATEILLKAKKVCLFPKFCYVYCMNTVSLTQNIKPIQLLEIQTIILRNIKAITLNYEVSTQFTNNILIYIEKYVYLSIAQSAFLFERENIRKSELIEAFSLFTEMTEKRLGRLSLAFKNKYYALYEVLFRYGIIAVFGIVLRSIRKKLKDSA